MERNVDCISICSLFKFQQRPGGQQAHVVKGRHRCTQQSNLRGFKVATPTASHDTHCSNTLVHETVLTTTKSIANVHVKLSAFDNELAVDLQRLQLVVDLERLQHELGVHVRREVQTDIAVENMTYYTRSVVHY